MTVPRKFVPCVFISEINSIVQILIFICQALQKKIGTSNTFNLDSKPDIMNSKFGIKCFKKIFIKHNEKEQQNSFYKLRTGSTVRLPCHADPSAKFIILIFLANS